jgi:hypothetical protein
MAGDQLTSGVVLALDTNPHGHHAAQNPDSRNLTHWNADYLPAFPGERFAGDTDNMIASGSATACVRTTVGHWVMLRRTVGY